MSRDAVAHEAIAAETTAQSDSAPLAPTLDGTLTDTGSSSNSVDAAPPPVEIGRYQIREELGRGGMGVVYEAWDPQRGQAVALKVLLAGAYANKTQQQRFSRELRAAARLEHPALIDVYEEGETENLAFFTMQLIRGPSLRSVIEERGRVPAVEAARLVAMVARGLHYAHEQGLIHRDVKPGNILLDEDGAPVLTDFGLVLDLDDEHSRLTASGECLGTPAYMAPEQIAGEIRRLGPPTDIYALGAVLYHLVTGSRPHGDSQRLDSLVRLQETEPLAPHLVVDEVPREISHICTRAMEFEPEHRYDSAAAFAEDLEYFAQGKRIATRGRPLRLRLRRWLGRHRVQMLVAVGVILAALATVIGGLIWQRHGESEQRARQERSAAERLQATEQRIATLIDKGRIEEADEVFGRFAEMPEHRDTRALARGWLQQGARLHERGDEDGEVNAFANAYATARSDVERNASLLHLASMFRRGWRWDQLEAVLDKLPAAEARSAGADEIRALHLAVALRRRDLQTSLALVRADAPGPEREALSSLFSHLSTRVETDYRARNSTRVDRDGDGREELLLVHGARKENVLVATDDPRLPALARYRLPEELGWPRSFHGLSAAGQPGLLLTWHEKSKEAALLSLPAEGTQMTPVYRWQDYPVGDAVRADLDSDGTVEVYAGMSAYSRHLLALYPQADGDWTMTHPHPQTDHMSSDVESLLAVDLDGDGSRELAVALGAWNAYDVRVLRPQAGGGFELAGRRKMGVMRSLVALPAPTGDGAWLAALKFDTFPNPNVFSPDRPTGEPAGTYLFSWRDERLAIERHFPLPSVTTYSRSRLFAGDFNGDGRWDLVRGLQVDGGYYTVIYIQLPAGEFHEVAIGGIVPLNALDVDGDRAHELVVYAADEMERVWVLGAGEETLPVLEGPVGVADAERVPVPAGLDAALRRTWERAEDLAALGLGPQAAQQLRSLAALTARTEVAAQINVRAASLLESAGHYGEAAPLYEEAAHAAPGFAAFTGAARCFDQMHRFADAERVLSELLEHTDVSARERSEAEAQLAEIRALTDTENSLAIQVGDPLGPEWRIETPVGLRRDSAENALRIDVVDQQRATNVARLPVHWDGRRLTLTAELDIEILEWAASLSVALRSLDGEVVAGVGVAGRGGDRALEWQIGCFGKSGELNGLQLSVEHSADKERVALQLDLGRGSVSGLCRVDAERTERTWEKRVPWVIAHEPGLYEVVLAAYPRSAAESARAGALIRAIHVTGVRVSEFQDPERALQRVYRELTNGRAERALALTEALSAEVTAPALSLLRSIVLDELGRFDDADAALVSALQGGGIAGLPPELWAQIHTLLRLRPERIAPLLRRTLSPAHYFGAINDNWSLAAAFEFMNLRAKERVFNMQLQGLLQASAPADFETLEDYTDLLRARAKARLGAGRIEAARTDIARVLELLQAFVVLPERDSKDTSKRVQRLMATAHVEYAATLVADRNIEGALEHIRQVFEVSPMPTAHADFLARYPGLEALHQHPVWRELVDSRRQ